MIKRSPSRNHRSRGIKVKHVLQIILLLGVCFWLIYQVKRSHDKKKEFDESDAKVSVETQTADQILKLGRKDLHSGNNQVNQNEKHEEEDDDENIAEDEDKPEHNEHEEEGNEHETVENEEDKHGVKGRAEEIEEDEREGGDDEIDENDQEKSEEVDADRDEEFMDEEREKEEEGDEKENENSEDEEREGSVENHHNHEAREEHYKGDDASSAVTHDTHTTSTESETLSLENTSDVNLVINITKSENKPNYTEDSNRNQASSDFNITEVQLTGGTSSHTTSGKETGNNSLSNPVDSSHVNTTATAYSDSHSEANSNLTVVIPGASNNMTGSDTSSEHNEMLTFSGSSQAQNNTVNTTSTADVKNVQTERLEQGGNGVSDENLPGSNLTLPVKTENGAATGGESSNLEGTDIEKTTRIVASNEAENKVNIEMSATNKTRNNLNMKENTNATMDEEFKGDTQTSETSDSSSANGTSNSAGHHATYSSDSHILKEVTEVRTDLDTLPDIRNEGDNGDKTATG